MKTTKTLLLLLTVLWSVTISASTTSELELKKDPFSEEISKLLSRSSLFIEEDITVKVIFEVTGEKKIKIRSITSSHAGVKSFLEARLEGQQLHGNNWYTNKIYELPVRVKAIR